MIKYKGKTYTMQNADEYVVKSSEFTAADFLSRKDGKMIRGGDFFGFRLYTNDHFSMTQTIDSGTLIEVAGGEK